MERQAQRALIRKSKQIRQKVLYVLVLCFAILLVRFAMGNQVQPPTKSVYYSVSIQSGDTLWGIASTYRAEGQSTEHMVAEIMKLNSMRSPNIKAGESIIVPVAKLL